MIEQLKKIKRVLSGKDFFYKTNLSVKNKKIGSDYGGWWIATDNLKDKSLIVLSFGLGEDISFDLQMIEDYQAEVFGFDPTPKAIKYVESMNPDKKFKLYKYALSEKTGTLTFNLPENEEHVSGSLEKIPSSNTLEVVCKDIKSICNEIDIKSVDILKMDIEGSEYRVIQNMIQAKIFPKQVLIEYHHFFNSISKKDTVDSIELLLSNGYKLFHIDGYNYSFLRQK